MVAVYKPKEKYFNETKVQKQIKSILDENKQDRTLALESYEYFKSNLEEEDGSGNVENQRLMLDSLKIAQSARNNSIKLVALLLKSLEPATGSTTTKKKDSGAMNPLFTKT